MGCSVKCVGAVGLTFTIIFGILGIAGLVLACVNFKATDFSWVDGAKWKSLGGITISSVCIVLFIMIFGIIEFTCCIGSKAFSVFYEMKRWVNSYHEPQEINDKEGHSCIVIRGDIIRQYLLYVIHACSSELLILE